MVAVMIFVAPSEVRGLAMYNEHMLPLHDRPTEHPLKGCSPLRLDCIRFVSVTRLSPVQVKCYLAADVLCIRPLAGPDHVITEGNW